ncbi:endoglucanase 3 [Hordeum vulgare]|nr:endoglucanase 3 [Hordeum vulgare]
MDDLATLEGLEHTLLEQHLHELITTTKMLQAQFESAQAALNPRHLSTNTWTDFEEAFMRNFNGTYKHPCCPRELVMCVHGPDESLYEYPMCFIELHNSCEGVYDVQAIQYFFEGCWYGALLKRKLMCFEPATLAELMVKEDKYATANSTMRVKGNSADKAMPTQPINPKAAADRRL